jgi:hypothetical protein
MYFKNPKNKNEKEGQPRVKDQRLKIKDQRTGSRRKAGIQDTGLRKAESRMQKAVTSDQ